MDFEITHLKPEQIEAAVSFHNAHLGESDHMTSQILGEKLEKNQGIFLIAIDKESQKIIGLKFAYFEDDKAIGRGIAVDEKWRRLGIAQKLVRTFESELLKFPQIKSYIFGSATQTGIPFHLAMGYTPRALLQFSDPTIRKNLDLKNFEIIEEKFNEKFQIHQILLKIDPEKQNLANLETLQQKFPSVDVQYLFKKTVEELKNSPLS